MSLALHTGFKCSAFIFLFMLPRLADVASIEQLQSPSPTLLFPFNTLQHPLKTPFPWPGAAPPGHNPRAGDGFGTGGVCVPRMADSGK